MGDCADSSSSLSALSCCTGAHPWTSAFCTHGCVDDGAARGGDGRIRSTPGVFEVVRTVTRATIQSARESTRTDTTRGVFSPSDTIVFPTARVTASATRSKASIVEGQSGHRFAGTTEQTPPYLLELKYTEKRCHVGAGCRGEECGGAEHRVARKNRQNNTSDHSAHRVGVATSPSDPNMQSFVPGRAASCARYFVYESGRQGSD